MTTAEQIAAEHKWLLALCRKMTMNADDGEDLCGTVILKAVKAAGAFDGRCPLKNWLGRIANRTWKDECRWRARRVRTSSLSAIDPYILDHTLDMADPSRLPDELPNELSERFVRLLSRLTDSDRAVMTAFAVAGDYEGAASLLGISVSNFKTKLYRVRRDAKATLSRIRVVLG